jgi:diguanylate cyclase (GGDEF)-like protein
MTDLKDNLAVPNKTDFDEALTHLLCGDDVAHNTPMSVAFLDVDKFLEVNTTSGREAGDSVLAQLAALFMQRFENSPSLFFRIGGDEYAALMPEIEKERAFLQLEQIRSDFENLDTLADVQPRPTISIGIATFPDDGGTPQEVIRKADDALFRAKGLGRNRIGLAREEKKVPKTSHYTQGQLDRLSVLSKKEGVGEAELLREGLDDLLKKYTS